MTIGGNDAADIAKSKSRLSSFLDAKAVSSMFPANRAPTGGPAFQFSEGFPTQGKEARDEFARARAEMEAGMKEMQELDRRFKQDPPFAEKLK